MKTLASVLAGASVDGVLIAFTLGGVIFEVLSSVDDIALCGLTVSTSLGRCMRDLGVCVEVGAAAWKFVSAWKHLGFVAWAIELSTRGGRGRGWHRCFASYLPLTDLWSFLLSAFTIFRLSFQLSRHVGS